LTTAPARTRFTDAAKLTDHYIKDRYRTESRAQPTRKEVEQAMDMINKAERLIIVAGQGVFLRKAWASGIFAGRWLRANRPGQSVACAYQYGAIGPDMAMMVGIKERRHWS
jgi:glyoxylate carboligase